MNIESQSLNKSTKAAKSSLNSAVLNSQNVSRSNHNSFKGELDFIANSEQTDVQNGEFQEVQEFNSEAYSSAVTIQASSKAGDAKSLNNQQSTGANAASPESLDVDSTVIAQCASQATSQSTETQVEMNVAAVVSGASNKKGLTSSKGGSGKILEKGKNVAALINSDESSLLEPLKELNSKIATLSEIKKGVSKSKKATRETFEVSLDSTVIKMNSNDALFFANLVNGEKLQAQATGVNNTVFSEIKTEAAQSTMQVSATLMDAINESMKTNKPFRIDFDKNIAVILRVDKEGKISADFIPGDKAVEQYLKNNIPLLKERFDEQNLQYNDLSYQRHKQQREQSENNRKEHKENDDE